MQPYLATARRFRWVVSIVLALVWGVGLAAAWIEYTTTYESAATVWVVRAAGELTVTDPNDPNIAVIQTAAASQAEVLKQLLQTRTFVADVINRTSLHDELASAADQRDYLDRVQKRFRVEALGTSLLRVSFAGHDPQTPSELVNAALAVRAERLSESRSASAAALTTLYQHELRFAQQRAQEAQRALDQFNKDHTPPLSEADDHVQGQLRLTLDLALVRVGDLRGRMERSALGPAVLEVSGIEFQIIDAPRVETAPSGGERSAIVIAIVAFVAGAGLVTLLILLATLLGDRIVQEVRTGGERAPLTTTSGTAGARGSASTVPR
jgi:uncharacterized protein involved in exopolysaccharide biosynthesis